jgi:hypothetical protein
MCTSVYINVSKAVAPHIFIFIVFHSLFQFLSKNGLYEFWNWFDDRTWYNFDFEHVNPFFKLSVCSLLLAFRYPLGRVIGGTVYPGLTLTAGTIWWYVNVALRIHTIR